MAEVNKLDTIKTTFDPAKDTSQAEIAANKLVSIVKSKGWAVKVGQGEHLMYEAWQTLGKYYGLTVKTFDAEPITVGSVQGFKAKAVVIDNKTGIEVGGAEAYCMKDEPNWRNKPLFQLASMAQTRSGAKALRQILAFVVALAGFNPTPAEEMDEPRVAPAPKMTLQQQGKIADLLETKGKDLDDLEKVTQTLFKKNHDEITKLEAEQIIARLQALPDVEDAEIDIDEIDKAIK